jgi:hypothetical protein
VSVALLQVSEDILQILVAEFKYRVLDESVLAVSCVEKVQQLDDVGFSAKGLQYLKLS